MKSSVRNTLAALVPCCLPIEASTAQGIAPYGDLARGPMAAEYTVAAESAATQDGVIPLQISLRIANPPRQRAIVEIPVWTPGSYRLRDFPDRIRDLRATAGKRKLEARRLHPSAWEIATGDAAEIVVDYRVELRPTDRFMFVPDSRRCITYEGPAVYLYLRGHLDIPCRVRFELPAGWSAASGLLSAGEESGGSRDTWFAGGYDFLADCPVKIGRFQTFAFSSHGARIEVVLDAGEDLEFDHRTWVGNIEKIVHAAAEMFGGLPVDRYVFLFTANPRGGGGGLEHLTSTAIGVPRSRLARDPGTGLGTVAHEFFHLWNVKRLRPVELGPFAYDRPNRTPGLWVSEGITSYYTDVLLARAGLRDEQAFWNSMARQIQNLESNPGRHHTSSEKASLSVWDQKAPDRRISYYNSGLVLGLLLDLEIRHATGNRRSLDDLMRQLYRFCLDEGRGFHPHEVPMLASAVAGIDLRPWFDRHVAGTVVPDYARVLGYAGIDYREDRETSPVLRGVRRDRRGRWLFADHAAMDRSGSLDPLQSGGLLLAVDGVEPDDPDDLARQVQAAAAAGRTFLPIDYQTGSGDRRTVHAAIEPRHRVRVRLVPRQGASEDQRAIARGILTGVPAHPASGKAERR